MAAQIPTEIKAARREIAKARDLLKEAFTNPYIEEDEVGAIVERQLLRLQRATRLLDTYLVDRQQDSLWRGVHGAMG